MANYLEKQALFPPQIKTAPSADLGIIVVIPSYNELELIQSLEALKCCKQAPCDVEVIVVINDGELETAPIKSNNQKCFEEAQVWANTYSEPSLQFHILYFSDLPKKHAGVGLARKIGMDEACVRFNNIKNTKGIIACFDADALCDKNYLQVLHKHFKENEKTQACSIYYEHPLEGKKYSKDIYKAILAYELHLRYYTHAQRYANFPLAFETIGSSMAVRCDAYQKQGGMNKRKAGEDFYFIHKFTPLGHFSEIKNTRVIPSPRISNRVPFGTGRAVGEILEEKKELTTYAPQSFIEIASFFKNVKELFSADSNSLSFIISQQSKGVQAFLFSMKFNDKLEEIINNTTNVNVFEKRFYAWFNAFMMMKYVHFRRDHHYPNVKIGEAAQWLLEQIYHQKIESENLKDLLLTFRKIDRDVVFNDFL